MELSVSMLHKQCMSNQHQWPTLAFSWEKARTGCLGALLAAGEPISSLGMGCEIGSLGCDGLVSDEVHTLSPGASPMVVLLRLKEWQAVSCPSQLSCCSNKATTFAKHERGECFLVHAMLALAHNARLCLALSCRTYHGASWRSHG